MILKGNTRTGASDLVNHLMNVIDNDHVEVHTLKDFSSQSFADALYETEAIAKGTKCSKPFYSLSLNPPSQYAVSEQDFEDAIDQVGTALGLTDQPRAVIFHEKEGRRHCHVVWSRIDAESMKAISDSNDRYKLQDASRALFLQHGWELPKGLEKGERGSDNNTSRADQEIAKRSGLSIEDHNNLMRKAWAQSDNAKSFAQALEGQGYILAQGRRGFVGIDIYTSDAHSIPRRVGLKKREVEAQIGLPTALPSVEDARQLAEKRRGTIIEALTQEQTKLSKKTAAQEKLEELKKTQRQEREDLIRQQKASEKAQERSFVQKLFGDLKSFWDASAIKLTRLRDKWFATAKEQEMGREIVKARDAQTKTHRNQRDHLRQSHLKTRRALQGDLLKERNANKQKIIFQRARLVLDDGLEARKAAIRAKFERDKAKGLER